MKKIFLYIRIILFFGIMVFPTICWSIVLLCGKAESLDFDIDEKREKHTIPSDVRVSELPAELEAYYNDRLPFRSILIIVNNKINTKLEKTYMKNIEPALIAWLYNKNDNEQMNKSSYIGEEPFSGNEMGNEEILGNNTGLEEASDNETEVEETVHEHDFKCIEQKDSDYENYGYEIYKCSACGEEKKYILDKLVDTSLYPMKIISDNTIIGRYNWMFYEDTLSDYQGYNIIAEGDYAEHVRPLVNLKNICDELGKEIYFIIIPNKNSVYPEYMPTVSRAADKRRVEYLKEYIDANTDIILQYPLKEMYAKKPYHQIYFKYDTHWSPYGYQVGVNSLYTAMGMEPIDYEGYEIIPNERRKGDLAALAGIDLTSYPPDVDGRISYKPEISCEEIVMEDVRCWEAASESDNKKKIVLMGDSYRFGFGAFLSKDFSHMCIFDRVLKGNENIENQIKEADAIVIALVERNEYLLPEDANYLYNVLTK